MKKIKNVFVVCFIIALFTFKANAQSQNVSINATGNLPDNSAILDVSSTDKGILIPRMTTAQRTTILAPAKGLLVYDTNFDEFWYFDGTIWVALGATGPQGPIGPAGPTGATGPQGQGGVCTAGNNITITGAGTTVSPYVINSILGGATHYIGELFGGGVVFWVDRTGNHGLICSMIDLSPGIIWTTTANQSITVPPPGALSDWNGQANATAIVAQAGAGSSYAAGLCDAYTNADYGTGAYSDWYLPTIDDLNLLYNAKRFVNETIDNDGNGATTAVAKFSYWSSVEFTNIYAWYYAFQFGNVGYGNKSATVCVRAIRAF